MKEWAIQSPYLAAIIIYTALEIIFRIINRFFRMINIWQRGWPTAQNMDADGDIVHSKDIK